MPAISPGDERRAVKLYEAAQTALLLEQPFWGALCLHLGGVVDASCKTACTDGNVIRYNPDYWLSLSGPERLGLLAHETYHCANGHLWRLPPSTHGEKGNIAAAIEIRLTSCLQGDSVQQTK